MNKKFTLIELMVVIAIIGILTSILMPSIAKSREKAKQAVCMSQLRQSGTMVIMSIGDQNGYYHSPQGTGTGTYYNPLWSNWLQRAVSEVDDQVFLCPSRDNPQWNNGWGAYASRTSNNGTARYDGSRGGDINYVQLESSDWLIGDGWNNGASYAWHRMTTDTTTWKAQPWMLHLERGNMLFADGSVKSMSKGDYGKSGFSIGWSMNKIAVSF